MNRYVIKVEPHRAILEADYFIKQIEIAESSIDDEIEKVEAGIDEEDEDKEPVQVDEWQAL